MIMCRIGSRYFGILAPTKTEPGQKKNAVQPIHEQVAGKKKKFTITSAKPSKLHTHRLFNQNIKDSSSENWTGIQ